MMSAKEHILHKIRKGLSVHEFDDLRTMSVDDRLRGHPRSTTPSYAQGNRQDIIRLFTKMAIQASATVETIKQQRSVPWAIANFVRKHATAGAIRVGTDPFLADLPWRKEATLDLKPGAAIEPDQVGLSVAAAAAAETGTAVLTSGPDNPTTINFLPENHIIIVPASRIVPTYEDAWDLLRSQNQDPLSSRAVVFITGPSRTADVEQKLLLGAHGPRRLHIITVDGA
jgi:L-lactate dehydrogenase complex protein LldG